MNNEPEINEEIKNNNNVLFNTCVQLYALLAPFRDRFNCVKYGKNRVKWNCEQRLQQSMDATIEIPPLRRRSSSSFFFLQN